MPSQSLNQTLDFHHIKHYQNYTILENNEHHNVEHPISFLMSPRREKTDTRGKRYALSKKVAQLWY
jgi:hypothetical protein